MAMFYKLMEYKIYGLVCMFSMIVQDISPPTSSSISVRPDILEIGSSVLEKDTFLVLQFFL